MTLVRMWEAVVLPGELGAARKFCLGSVVPAALATEGCVGARAYEAPAAEVGADEDRVVVITEWVDGVEPDDWDEGLPFRRLFRRDHGWWFRSMEPAVGAVRVRPRGPQDDVAVRELLEDAWGGSTVVSRGTAHDASALPGLVAEDDDGLLGLLTYAVDGRGLEVVTLDALVPRRGVGRALLRAAEAEARRQGASRLWLVTTNDNTGALAFSQRCGLRLVALHAGAVAAAGRLGPAIPLVGDGGVPITDELELARDL